jgi:hypothetical protein
MRKPIFSWCTLACSLWLGGTLLVAGCSAKGTVSGKVQYRSQPLPGGSVIFVPDQGAPLSTLIQEDGRYMIQNVPPGNVKIAVETDSASSFADVIPKMQRVPKGALMGPPREAFPKGAADGPSPQTKGKRVPIPQQYGDPDKSGLTYTVKSGKQEHNIELK